MLGLGPGARSGGVLLRTPGGGGRGLRHLVRGGGVPADRSAAA